VESFTLEQAEEEIAQLRGQVDLMSEILKLNTQGVPNNPSSGQVELYGDSASNLPGAVLASGMNGVIPVTKTVWQPLNTVTAATLQNLAAFTINAGDAQPLAVYEIEVWGDGKQGSTAQTLELSVVLGGTALQNVVLASGSMAANNSFRWYAKGRVICITNGSSAAWQSSVKANWSLFNGNIGPGNNNFAEAFSCEANTTTTVGSTAANTLGISAAWGATTGAPTLTSRIALGRRWT
jgi:hypothetical protein